MVGVPSLFTSIYPGTSPRYGSVDYSNLACDSYSRYSQDIMKSRY